ncbi:MAG: aminoacyl-tRNA hydrolase [Cryomorphaceae bacterium]|jgi:PTH1 family peptidyl-tRNA hydrolase|nr:aminoacyl-tRNA hydrolase [Cryomorphaceae bacterium]
MKKFLVVGLGNPGSEYARTRHNIGFDLLDAWASAHSASFSVSRLGDRAQFSIKGRTVVLIKPSTFMNLSGKAVRYWMEEEKIPLENLVVVVDELALPVGHVRLKLKGSDGGHNGLKDIQATLGRQDYARQRIGIGQHFPKGHQVDFVLGRWTPEELEFLNPGVERAIKQLEAFMLAGPSMAMTQYNQ